MDNSRTIICHSFPAWDTPYVKSTIELMTRLTKDYRVIYIDYHYTLKDAIANPNAPKKQLFGMGSRWRTESTKQRNIELYNFAPILPINWIKNKTAFKWAAKLNGALLNWQIKRFVKKNKLEGSVLINAFNPIYGTLTKESWKANKSIYYCYDEISGTNWSGKHGPDYEKEFMSQVDQVIVSSSKLKENKKKYNSNTQLVPNGVNLDLFQTKEAMNKPSKSIGYVGAVDERIDFELVNKMAERYPNLTFDFFGPLKVPASNFKHENIHLHGNLQQHELPSKIQAMDACIIPFVKNELTASIYPLKANEYLAMGKPVVSTNFADLRDFADHMIIEDDAEVLLSELSKVVQNDSNEIRKSRIKFAQKNSWTARAALFHQLIAA